MSHLKSIEDILWRSKYWGSLKFEGLDARFFKDIWRCAAILSKEKQTYYNQEAQSRVQSWEGCYVQICKYANMELWRSSKFQGLRVSSSKRNTYCIRHRIRLTREYEVDENERREIALVFSFVPSYFRGLSKNYFLLLNWLRSRLLTRRNEREPGEKETGALGNTRDEQQTMLLISQSLPKYRETKGNV